MGRGGGAFAWNLSSPCGFSSRTLFPGYTKAHQCVTLFVTITTVVYNVPVAHLSTKSFGTFDDDEEQHKQA